jgi:hypothetical protein
MPPARLSNVMLLPERSNWQARVHDKFEGSAQGFDRKFEGGDAEIQPQQACLRLAPRVAGEGVAIKLSNWRIAQFLCSSFVSPTPAHGLRIHLFRRCSLTLDDGRRDRSTDFRRPPGRRSLRG